MVCQNCRNLLLLTAKLVWDWEEPQLGSDFVHHDTIESLQRAAERDRCMICRDLWSVMSSETQSLALEQTHIGSHTGGHTTFGGLIKDRKIGVDTPQDKSYNITGPRSPNDGPWELFIRVSFELEMHLGDAPSVSYLVYSEADMGPMAGVSKLHSSATSSLNARAIALQWLELCSTSHKSCNNDYQRNVWNPSRLLDVGTNGSSAVHLVDDFASTPLSYVTLSHRWGNAQFYQLTYSTEKALKAGLPVSCLPRTFQHAVEVARGLKYRYVWIDSLCIKQDDPSDWQREAALMHKVYRHAQMNISATAALDSSGGLYVERDELAAGYTPVEIRIDRPAGATKSCIAFHESFWLHNVSNAPINQRGWVVQERILSKRVLHFGSQLFWECREMNASETFLQGMPYRIWSDTRIKCLDPLTLDTEIPMPRSASQDPRYRAYNLWTDMARTYSECALTKAGDKLPALQGIAKHMSVVINDTYVAGMWRKYLPSELAWCVSRTLGGHEHFRPEPYIAPTWSWMSLAGPILCGYVTDEGIRAKIKDVQLDCSTDDKMGPLSGGRIYIEGVLRRIVIHRNPLVDSHEHHAWSLTLPDASIVVNLSMSPFIDVLPDNFDHANEDEALFCMELMDGRGQKKKILTLLLLQREQNEPATFTRVGPLDAHNADRDAVISCNYGGSRLPCLSWDSSSGLHTICVV